MWRMKRGSIAWAGKLIVTEVGRSKCSQAFLAASATWNHLQVNEVITTGDYDDVFNLFTSLWSLSVSGGIQRTVRLGVRMGALWSLDLSSSTRGRLVLSLDAFDHSYKCEQEAVGMQFCLNLTPLITFSLIVFLPLYFRGEQFESLYWRSGNGSNDRLLPPGGSCLRGRVHRYSAASIERNGHNSRLCEEHLLLF